MSTENTETKPTAPKKAPIKAPKVPKEPKAPWAPPARANEAVSIMREFANAGDKKVLAFFVREAIACREDGKSIRDAAVTEEVAPSGDAS